MRAEPSPCPWCKSRRLRKVGRCIECTSCGASGPEMSRDASTEEYIHAWNRRAPHSHSAATDKETP